MTDAERVLLLLVARYITDGNPLVPDQHRMAVMKDIAAARAVVLMETVEKLRKPTGGKG